MILVLILFYGIFKFRVLKILSPIAGFFLNILSIDKANVLIYLNEVTNQQKWNDTLLGWFLYYPSYILLHILFIVVLYHNRKKARNWLIVALIAVILILVLGIVVFKELESFTAYTAFVRMFRNLFGLPFILLVIEGGRILYNDIMRLISAKEE